jgi:hypothetical protein
MRIGRVIAGSGLTAAVIGVAACGSNTATGTGPGTTSFVLVQAAKRLGTASLVVDGKTVAANAALGQAVVSSAVSAGAHTVTIVPASGSAIRVSGTASLLPLTVYDVVAVDSVGQYAPQLLPNITYDTTSGVAHLRILHAATSVAGDSLNVYVTPAGVPSDSALHDSATAVVSTLGFPFNSGYVAVQPGTYEIRVSNYAFPDSVVARTTGVVVTAGQLRTVIAADAADTGVTVVVVSDTP